MDEANYLAAKEAFERRYCAIVSPPFYLATWQGRHIMVPSRSMRSASNEFMPTASWDRWRRDPTKRSYNSADFLPPPLLTPDGVFNTWLGFEAERLPTAPAGSVDRFLEHVSLVTGDKSEIFLDWCAHMVQRPGERASTFMVLSGPAGCGKSKLVDTLAEVIGDNMFRDETLPLHMVGLKNPGWLLTTIESMDLSWLAQRNRRVKQLVQSPSLTVEKKFCPALTVSNFSRLIITTRDLKLPEWLTKLGGIFIKASPDRVGDRAYFRTLDEYMKTPTNIRAIYDFLATRQLSVV